MAGSIRIGSAPAGPEHSYPTGTGVPRQLQANVFASINGDPTALPWPRPLLQGPALMALMTRPLPRQGAHSRRSRWPVSPHLGTRSRPYRAGREALLSPSAIILLPRGPRNGSGSLGIVAHCALPVPPHVRHRLRPRRSRRCSYASFGVLTWSCRPPPLFRRRTCRSMLPPERGALRSEGVTTGSAQSEHGTSDAVPRQSAVCCVADSRAQRQAAAH